MNFLSWMSRRGFVAGCSLCVILAWPILGQEGSSTLAVAVDNDDTKNVRLEIFDGDTRRLVYDTGILEGSTITLPVELFESKLAGTREFRYELRAWDSSGDLLLSQISTAKTLGQDEIWSINFEVIPAGTKMVGDSISLESSVDVSGDLTVAGATRTAEVQNAGGSSFFGSCSPGSSIRSISSSGAVTCQPDNTGADNLGNHTASQDLQMGNHSIDFNAERGLRASGGGEIRTGVNGQTFQFHAGGPAADTARFWDSSSNLILAINPSGLHFYGGQKVCSCYADGRRNTIVASGGWTASTCSQWRNQLCPGGDYQLFCVSETGFHPGTANGGLPNPNCGW